MLHFVQCGKGMATLTLLSLSLQKERDVSAVPKQGEVDASLGFASFSMTVHLVGQQSYHRFNSYPISERAFT